MSDTVTPLLFVDPNESDPTYRVCLWATPGEGKSVAAASAPDPILVLSADRPSAYRFARKHHQGKRIDEVRYQSIETIGAVLDLLKREPGTYRTVVIDPWSNIYDNLAENAPKRNDGDIDYQWVNRAMLRFVKELRAFDINVVLVAHEKLNDGKKGDGKLYPSLGGAALINKTLMEMDIVARIVRDVREIDGEQRVGWVAQLQPGNNNVCKESTGALGDWQIADLSRWFEIANEAYAPDESDLPWDGEGEEPAAEEEPEGDPAPDDDPDVDDAAQLAIDEESTAKPKSRAKAA